MAADEETTTASIGDMKGVVQIPTTDGGNFISNKKVALFDDEVRFLEQGNIVPAYYLKNAEIADAGPPNSASPDSWKENSVSRYWWEFYRSQTEDEVRSALGIIWRHSTGFLYYRVSPTKKPYLGEYLLNAAAAAGKKLGTHSVSLVEDWTGATDSSFREEVLKFPWTIGAPTADEEHPVWSDLKKLGVGVLLNEIQFVNDNGTVQRHHVDYTTTFLQPMSHKEIESGGFVNNALLYYKATSDYNFYIKSYENIIVSLQERNTVMLPNINVFLLEEMSRDKYVGHTDELWFTPFHEFITLDGNIQGVFIDVLNEKGEKIKEKSDGGQYFEKWSRAYNNLGETSGVKETLRDRYKDILMPYELNKKVAEYQNKKFMFPMFLDLEFATDTNCRLADLLDEFSLDGPLLKTIIEGSRDEFADAQAADGTWITRGMKNRLRFNLKNDLLWTSISSPPSLREEKKESARTSFKFFDNTGWNWLEQYGDKGAEIFRSPSDDSFSVLAPMESDYYKMLHLDQNNEGQFLNKLVMSIFKAKFLKLAREKTRSFKDILNGKMAYSEVVAYKIEKWSTNSDGSMKNNIQNYYYTNTSKLDILKHVDTQFKYGSKYHYRIFSWIAVFGTQYRYRAAAATAIDAVRAKFVSSGVQFGSDEDKDIWYKKEMGEAIDSYNGLDIVIKSNPIVKMIEVPYFSFTTKIADTPPLAPNVNMIPYKNVKNKFLINLSSQTGEVHEAPVIIEEGDWEIFLESYESQEIDASTTTTGGAVGAGGLGNLQPLFFQSDDPTTVFQIFKIITPPESYEDFNGSMTEYDTAEVTGAAASSFSLVDNNVAANTKYYYTFRAKDVHGNISNPSPVYKIEIVDNSGAVYLLVDLFDFKDARKKPKTTKDVQRYISIVPTYDQMVFNEDATEDTHPDSEEGMSATKMDPKLGFAEDSVFNRGHRKYFKVRLISKRTGKKIDFNLDFVYEHKNSEIQSAEDIQDSDSATTPN